MLLAVLLAATLASCRAKKDVVYRWQNSDESRSLTLKRDNSFILEINAGYYFRVDTGTFLRKGDTLVINPDKEYAAVDSLVGMDSLYFGHRFVEVMQPVIDFGMDNEVTGTYLKGIIFPEVVVNDTLGLSVDPDDPSYRRLRVPDSVQVRSFMIRIPEERTCNPELAIRLTLSPHESLAKSFRLYLRSHDSRSHYLAGYKWLIRGDTIMTSFVDEGCTPGDMKLVRVR